MNTKQPTKPTKQWQKNEQRRQQGLELLEQGQAPKAVAKQLGVGLTTVHNWKRRPAGEAGAITKPGAKLGLTDAQVTRLLQLLEEGPTAHGFEGEVWTGKRISQLIWEHFGVRYHFKSIPPLLERLGWSWQMPERRASERKDDKIAQWIDEDWPRIKKKPRNWGPLSSSSTSRASR